jgi:solute carrier family 35 protein E1
MRVVACLLLITVSFTRSLKIAQLEKSSIAGLVDQQESKLPTIDFDIEESFENRQRGNTMQDNDKLPVTTVVPTRLEITPLAIKLCSYYFLHYLFSVVFSVTNKRVLNALPLPATMASIQLLLGIPLFLPLWIMKPPRNVHQLPKTPLMVASISHALGNLATIYSFGAGSVSFVHVVKSAEPVFAAVLAGLLNKSFYAPQVYLTLLPIVLGVALASCSELTFSWFGFVTAMISNFFYQLRIVVSKPLLATSSDGSKISGGNLYRVLTVIAAIFLVPISLYLEGNAIMPAWRLAATSPSVTNALLLDMVMSGFSFYMYNEVSFWVLDLVHPVTHAVGNTLKRVVLIVAATIIFRAPVTLEGAVGSLIAVGGSFLYALASQRYNPSK